MYVFELSYAAYCNLIAIWKFLNGGKPDVHDSPDPLSLPWVRRGGAGHEIRELHVYEKMGGGGGVEEPFSAQACPKQALHV